MSEFLPSPRPSVADVAGFAVRFTDYSVPDAGIRELFTTKSIWQAYLDVEAALAFAEAELGIVPKDAAELIARSADLSRLDLARIRSDVARQSHPVVPLISELVRAVGPAAGGHVHWGATSQNIMHSGSAILMRRAHGVLIGLLDEILGLLADLAERGAGMLMAGRTHGQHAVPITFGFKAAVWIDELVRARRRLESSASDLLTAMMGGAVGNFASLGEAGPRVQELVADRLGLRSMAVPSRSTFDPEAAYAAALAIASASCARASLDIATLMQTEFGEASEPVPEGAVGSSTMPHKRNPKLSYDVMDLSSRVRALLSEVLEAMVRPHEADGGATAIVDDRLREAVVAMGDLLVRQREILAGLELFPERMLDNLRRDGSVISSEAVMLALGEEIGRDHAHEVVYEDAMRAARTGEDFAEVLAADERVTARLGLDRLRDLLDPAAHAGLSARIARQAAERARAARG